MTPDKLTRFGEQIQRAKAQAMQLTNRPEDRSEIMQAMLLGEALIEELRGKQRAKGGES